MFAFILSISPVTACIPEILCLMVIALAIYLGVRAIRICHPRLAEFDTGDVRAFVANPQEAKNHEAFWGWAYPLIVGFTLLCIVAFLARIGWALNVGWSVSGQSWATTWLGWHISAGLLIAWFQFGIVQIYKAYVS